MAVGSSVLAAPFQNRLRGHLREHFRKVILFVIQNANAAGYLAGTDPAKGADDKVEAGLPTVQELMTRPETWTPREQEFMQEWWEAVWERAEKPPGDLPLVQRRLDGMVQVDNDNRD